MLASWLVTIAKDSIVTVVLPGVGGGGGAGGGVKGGKVGIPVGGGVDAEALVSTIGGEVERLPVGEVERALGVPESPGVGVLVIAIDSSCARVVDDVEVGVTAGTKLREMSSRSLRANSLRDRASSPDADG